MGHHCSGPILDNMLIPTGPLASRKHLEQVKMITMNELLALSSEPEIHAPRKRLINV